MNKISNPLTDVNELNNTEIKIESIIQNIVNAKESDINYLLSTQNNFSQKILCECSQKIRYVWFGNKMLTKAKICISNYCSQNCEYCFCKHFNKTINRYRLDVESIIKFAKKISALGIKSIILKSGVDNFFNTDMISHIIYTIKSEVDVDVTLSLCERKKEEYFSWAIAGADNYLFIYGLNDKYINLDNVENEEDIIKFSEFQQKKIKVSVELIIGVPKQRNEDLAKILLMLKNSNIESLIVTPYTSFASSIVNKNEINKSARNVISVARLLMPDRNIFSFPSVTGSYKMGDQSMRSKQFGNNGVILDFSPTSDNYFKLVGNKKKGKLIYSA